MKNNWQTKRLGEVLLKTETVNPTLSSNNEFQYIDVSSVSNKNFTIQNVSTLLGRNAPSRARKKVQSGDIIFATVRPTLKRIAIIPKSLDNQICSTGYFVFRAGEKINSKLLFYFLLSDQFHNRIEKLQRGTSYPAITDKDIINELISFPESLDEQKRIVALLDDVFEKIKNAKEHTKKTLQNSRELFETYLHEIYLSPHNNWTKKTISDIASVKGGKRVPKGYKLASRKTEHPYIRVADFNEHGSINLNDIRFIDDSIYNQIKQYTISSKDLYISIAGTIGKTGIIPTDLDGANLTENACKLVFKEGINNKYVYYYTKSKDFQNQVGINTRIAAMPKLALTRLSSISFFIPPSMKEQQDIVNKLDELSEQTRRLQAIYKRKLADLEELRKAFLEKAFSGEL